MPIHRPISVNLIRSFSTLFKSHPHPQPQILLSLLSDTSRSARIQVHNQIRNTMSLAAITKRIEGKTIVITGASSGIGRSTAVEFARTAPNNLRLILTARRIDTLKEVAAQIEKETPGVKVLPVKLDVSNPDEVRSFVGNLPEEWRDINVLVNNAGLVKGVDKAPGIKEEDVNVMFATNVTGLINVTQAILPIFLKRPEGGQGDIVNIGSIAGREPYPGGSIYCATKAAVRTFTESLRKELIATRIRVIGVDPGQVETVSGSIQTALWSEANRAIGVLCC